MTCLLALGFGVIYGLVGWYCRHKEQASFRAFVTPTHLIVRKVFYRWLCCDPEKRDQVIPLSRVQAVEIDCICYKTLRVYTDSSSRDADDQPALSLVCLEDPEALRDAMQGVSVSVGTGAGAGAAKGSSGAAK